MMDYENQGSEEEEAHLYSSREEMENLVLEDPLPLQSSSSNGHNLSDRNPLSSHPFTSDDDPLLASSPSTMHPQSPNTHFNSILLEPPCYADVIFTSFDLSNSNSVANPNLEPESSGEYLYISVLDPQKEQEDSYYTYLITTRTNLPDFGGSKFSVRRRFRDVVTLSDRLSECYRGFFIPLRPDKNVVDSQVMQKNEFVQQRRAALEKYLRKLVDHPVLKKSQDLRLFLQVRGNLLFGEPTMIGAVDVSEVSQPPNGGRDLFRMFKELKQSVTNDWGGSKPAVVEEDKYFMENKEKLQDLEQQLSNVSQQAELLVKAQQDIGETLGELGLAFVKLTKFETEEAMCDSQRVRSADMKNVATAVVKASRLYRELNAQTVKHLDKLHEYLGIMLAVNNAFSDRSSALLTVQTLLSELSSLHSRIEKLEVASSKIFGGDRSRNRKIEELKETVRITEDAKSCAVKEYERIKDNNKNELKRLDKERHNDLLNMLKGFVVNQAGYAEKMANVWETVAEETSGYSKHGS